MQIIPRRWFVWSGALSALALGGLYAYLFAPRPVPEPTPTEAVEEEEPETIEVSYTPPEEFLPEPEEPGEPPAMEAVPEPPVAQPPAPVDSRRAFIGVEIILPPPSRFDRVAGRHGIVLVGCESAAGDARILTALSVEGGVAAKDAPSLVPFWADHYVLDFADPVCRANYEPVLREARRVTGAKIGALKLLIPWEPLGRRIVDEMSRRSLEAGARGETSGVLTVQLEENGEVVFK